LLAAHLAAIEVGFGGVGIQSYRLVKFPHRCLELPFATGTGLHSLLKILPGEIAFQADRHIEIHLRPCEVAHLGMYDAPVVIGVEVICFEMDGLFIVIECAIKISCFLTGDSSVSKSLRVIRIELNCLTVRTYFLVDIGGSHSPLEPLLGCPLVLLHDGDGSGQRVGGSQAEQSGAQANDALAEVRADRAGRSRIRASGGHCAEFLFQVISERTERAAIIVTTNLPFSEWPQVFTNARLCKAVLDRLTDQAHIIETGSESYRFRRTRTKKQKQSSSNAMMPE
jgi:hypothetical protein